VCSVGHEGAGASHECMVVKVRGRGEGEREGEEEDVGRRGGGDER
jgi:hypothetical protein